MKAYKILTLTLSLFLIASISMASNKKTKADKLNSEDKIEIANKEILDKAAEIVVLEATNNSVSSIPMDTKESIYDVLTYPKFAQDDQQKDVVVFSFTYTEDGFLKILSLNSSDEELNPYIISKLENIKLKDGSVIIGKPYYARIQFKLL